MNTSKLLKIIGLITAAEPNIKSVLDIFDPMILPIRMLTLCCLADESVTNNSGSDVPTAIMVSAIVSSLIPKIDAIKDADLTKYSAPK